MLPRINPWMENQGKDFVISEISGKNQGYWS